MYFGAKRENDAWRRRCKFEFCDMFNEPDTEVKTSAWTGHIVRRNNGRSIKKILNTKPERARSDGIPKLRWQDGVNRDMKTLRDEGTKLLKEAKVHQGLSSK